MAKFESSVPLNGAERVMVATTLVGRSPTLRLGVSLSISFQNADPINEKKVLTPNAEESGKLARGTWREGIDQFDQPAAQIRPHRKLRGVGKKHL